MADFQTLKDAVAQVVGGTAPDATNRPRWFSGDQSGDSTGLLPGAGYPTFKGCYSAMPEALEDYPVGIVLDGPAIIKGGGRDPDAYIQGEEVNIDDLRVLILLARADSEITLTNMAPYRDLVPAAFASHMTLFGTANVTQAMVRASKPITTTIGGVAYDGIEFTVRVYRVINRTYTA